MSNELFGNVEPDASGSENFDPQSMINDVFKDIQRNK